MTQPTLSRKIDFAVAFRVRGANPNGDPLNSNEPRTFGDDGHGEMTDVALKRKIRDRLQDAGHAIFVQSDDRRSDDARSLRARLEACIDIQKAPDEVARQACQKWLDVRAFGQLIALKAKAERKKGKGKKDVDTPAAADGEGDASEASISIGVRGPVSIQHAISIEPIRVSSVQITKSVSAEGDGSKRGSDTMGMKHMVEDATYVFYGAMNPQLAERTGFTDHDSEAIKAVLPRLFENDSSSARPEGSMEVLEVAWCVHDSKAGKQSSAKVHRALAFDPTIGRFARPDLEGVDITVLSGF
jgi:CRISPR-associated protein Csd2